MFEPMICRNSSVVLVVISVCVFIQLLTANLFAENLFADEHTDVGEFEKGIAKILASRCVACHNSDEPKGGDLSAS